MLLPPSSFIADSIIDIEDMLKTVAFIKGHKWTSMMVKRVYFGMEESLVDLLK